MGNIIAKGLVGVAVATAFRDKEVENAMGRLRLAVDSSNEEELKVLGDSKDLVSVEQIVGGTIVMVQVVKLLGRIFKAIRS